MESEGRPQPMLIAEPEVTMPSLSNDALTVQVLLQNLKRAGYTGRHPLTLIPRAGYLSDWTRERWDQTTSELVDTRPSGQSLPSDIGQVIDSMVTSRRGSYTAILDQHRLDRFGDAEHNMV